MKYYMSFPLSGGIVHLPSYFIIIMPFRLIDRIKIKGRSSKGRQLFNAEKLEQAAGLAFVAVIRIPVF